MTKQFTVRIDKELLDILHNIADYEGRSANGQIIYLINQCVRNFEKEHGEIK